MSSENDKSAVEKGSPAIKKSTAQAQNDNSTQAIMELKEGLIALQQQNETRMNAQENKLAGLYQGLENVFSKIHQDIGNRDIHSTSSLDQLSETIIRSSEEMRKEYEEMEKLQDKRREAESQQYSHSITRTKIIAFPAMVLAFAGLIHMFYTVNVMEKAMTRMSQDMSSMRQDMSTLSMNVSTMSGNISGMRHDMNIMTRNVAPAMNGMRQMMPWSP